MKEYTLKTKQTTKLFGEKEVTYTVISDSLEDAVERLFISLKNWKWTKDQVRGAITWI